MPSAIPRADYRDNGFCLGWGYALRGLDGTRCPECGREFDPANPKTMRVPGMTRKPEPKPIPFSVGMIMYAVVAALGGAFALASGLTGMCLLALIAWALIFAAWATRGPWQQWARGRGHAIAKDPPAARHWRAIVIVLFVLCAISGIGWSRCPHGRYYRYGPVALFRSSGVGAGSAGGGPCRNIMTGTPRQLSQNWYFIGP